MQDDQIGNVSLKERIRRAYDTLRDAATVELEVWNNLSDKLRERLGRVRLRQLIAIEIKDPDQLEIAFEGEPIRVEAAASEVLERRGHRLIAIGRSFIRRGEAYLAEAQRRTGN